MIRPLTGLRGALALWVVLLHVTLALQLYGFSLAERVSPALERVLLSGVVAVDGFFILSGFILSYTYARTFAETPTSITAFVRQCWRFWFLRLARIYPTHLAVLGVYGVLLLGGATLPAACGNPANRDLACDRFSLAHLRDQVLLIASWGIDPVVGWNLPAWSVCSEWFVYLCFPVLIVVVLRLGAGGALAAAATALLAVSALTMLVLPRFLGLADDYGLLRALPEFFCGCCLYRLRALRSARDDRWLGHAGDAAVVAMLAAVAASVVPGVAPYCLAVLVLALAAARPGFVGWVLATAPLQWLGRISYSLYLTHLVTIEAAGHFARLGGKADPFKTPWLAARPFVFLLLAALAVAFLFNRAIEEPARNYLRGLLRRGEGGGGGVDGSARMTSRPLPQ